MEKAYPLTDQSGSGFKLLGTLVFSPFTSRGAASTGAKKGATPTPEPEKAMVAGGDKVKQEANEKEDTTEGVEKQAETKDEVKKLEEKESEEKTEVKEPRKEEDDGETNEVGDSSTSGGDVVLPGIRIVAYGGSVMSYTGGCMVNAANTGGVGGFGIDEMVNKAAGLEILQFRKGFGGIPTGEAKISPSFKHHRVKAIIHATGPHYHRDMPGMPSRIGAKPKTHAENDVLLAAAYTNALRLAHENKLKSVGYCLLSAGVFKGPRSMDEVIRVGLEALKAEVKQMLRATEGDPARCAVKEIAIVAFTPDEQRVLAHEFASVFKLPAPAKVGKVGAATAGGSGARKPVGSTLRGR